jgi:hypothetical protein
VQRGVLVRLRRGMYVSAERYAACDDSGKHLLHAFAALAAQGGQVALTGTSAAALHGFTIYQQDLSVVYLLRLDAGSGRRAASASHHQYRPAIDEAELVECSGVRTVSPARAVWEVASRSTLEAGVVTADSALRAAAGLRVQFEELQARFARVPGSRTARAAIALADPARSRPGSR